MASRALVSDQVPSLAEQSVQSPASDTVDSGLPLEARIPVIGSFDEALVTIHSGGLFLSKAFTKESESGDDDDEPIVPPLPGGKNYITPLGYRALRDELLQLIDEERPKIVDIVHWAASNGDRSENGDYLYGKKRLREIDRRIRFLTKRLEIAEVVDPSVHLGSDQIFFGATVSYREDGDVERTITIMGIDEADSTASQVSWIAPVARALLRARIGDEVAFPTPGGTRHLEVIDVRYPAPQGALEQER
jgi:transcription elongation factor GreB